MGVPNLGGFSALLQEDAIFRDYFNLFLNLPVFSIRFVYNAERQCFQVDTPVQSPYHVVAEPKLAAWIHSNRLPLFWNSDLFCDYQLCSELVQENEVLPAEVRQSLSTVAGLHCFRKFLFGGEGEATCLFWLEVQRLKHATEPWIAAKITSRIQQLYLRDGAPFSLSEVLKEMVLLVYTPRKNSPASARLKALVKAQAIVLQNLRTYWCKRYVIKLQESFSSCTLKETISEICHRETFLKTHESSPAHLPRIIVDEGKGSDDQEARKLSHLQLSESVCKLPLVKSNGTLLSDGSNNYERDPVEFVISPSTQKLFAPLMPSKLQTEEHIHDLPFRPYLFASLRADFMAGNPILRHFQRSPKVVNYLLFWQSVENILTRDEMRRWCHRQAKTNVHPYSAHFETYPIANTPRELLRLFMNRRAHHKVDLPSDVRNELILLLPKGLGQSLLLSAQDYVAKCLLQPWQDFLLYDYRDFISNCTVQRLLGRLSSPHRKEHTRAVMAVMSLPHLLEQTYGCSRLTGMWTALKLAEAAKYPGVYLLPSRQVMNVSLQRTPSCSEEDNDSCLSDYGDLDPIEQARISVHPMVTTVYNTMFRKPHKSIHRILCTTVPVHSTDLQHKKLPPPKTFLEMLKDPEHLELFHYFLQSQGSSASSAEMQLLFWMAVEDVKASMGNRKACNSKTKRIQQRFCGGGRADSVLQCRDPAISELNKKDRLSPFQLLGAQAAVAETLEKRWFQEYLDFLATDDCEEEEVAEDTAAKKPVCREHTKGLWNMFTVNVISFRRGLMNPSTAELFRNFLQEEVVKASSGSHKKVVGTKVVNVTKLLSDLYFWAEVERYKDLADIVNAAKANGTHTPEDDIMVHKKAHAIINCYIDSAVYPRVQVNVSNEIVQYILDSLSQGLITRGLFHEAALNIFSVLITYWKRFCMARFAPKRKKSLASSSQGSRTGTTAPSSRHSQHSTLSLAHSRRWPSGINIFAERTASQWWDGGPILSFSLTTGLRWLRPTHDTYPMQQTEAALL